ncbi:MAG TPA: hypothetical protein VMU13_03600 [Candidatus Paceibacterota bacterium]|nr:hypothetical protein [Candidatus Paceibacterota bacterium]
MPPPPNNLNQTNDVPHVEIPQVAPAKQSSVGSLIGIVIILVLLVVGAFYAWGARLNKQSVPTQIITIVNSTTTTATGTSQ